MSDHSRPSWIARHRKAIAATAASIVNGAAAVVSLNLLHGTVQTVALGVVVFAQTAGIGGVVAAAPRNAQ